MGELKRWRDEKWVRIGLDGSIKGPCGTSKKQEEARPVFAFGQG